jgi:recombination DNA repair RAD52 pathway protein
MDGFTMPTSGITPTQYETLMRPLHSSRVAKRQQGGKQLSYLESWDVRAHLIRMFGFANFDIVTEEQTLVAVREYDSKDGKPMAEAIWHAMVRLDIRDQNGSHLCTYREGAVGGTAGPAAMIGEHHDNAAKTAASDALKRCAMNLGTQFGLSLYDNGTTNDVVKRTLVVPEGVEQAAPATPKQVDEAAEAALKESLGATAVGPDPSTAESEPTPTQEDPA